MMPFFFGARKRRLFGAYEAAHKSGSKGRAAVICAPWGDEYIYAHRTLRQLALRLTRSGFHVLRFDYYATGDSGGASGETDYEGSRADTETAIAELKEITGIARISLIGLRFGASLAADVGAKRAGELDALVLWDPVTAADQDDESIDAPAGFNSPDFEPLASRLPERRLVLTTKQRPPHAGLQLPVVCVEGEPPWLERNAQVGIVPVRALEVIEDWLS